MEAINGRITGARALWATATQAWFAPFAVLVAVCNVLLAIWVITDEHGKMPGQAIGSAIILSLTAALLVGLRLRWRAARPAAAVPEPARSTFGRRLGLSIVAAVAVVTAVVGAMVSVFMFAAGVLLLVGVVVVATHGASRGQPPVARRSSGPAHVVLADVLIVVGTLPALGVWWLIVPAVLALAVIGGVIGTGPGTRRRATAAV